MNPSRWRAVMRVCETDLQILVLDLEGDLLKAKLPLRSEHPRALVTVLEGMALRRPVESPTRGRKAKRKAAEATRKVEEAKNRELRKKLEQSKK